jgi:hypothetical protein
MQDGGRTMTTLNEAASTAGRRTLHAICELSRLAACGVCRADAPTQPCVCSGTGPDGLHVARFAAALRRGLITSADFAAVIEAAEVFTTPPLSTTRPWEAGGDIAGFWPGRGAGRGRRGPGG